MREANLAAHDEAFRRQRGLSQETLAETMQHFDVPGNAEDLCPPQFDLWRRPPVFADSLPFLQQADAMTPWRGYVP